MKLNTTNRSSRLKSWGIGLSALATGVFLGNDLTSSEVTVTRTYHCDGTEGISVESKSSKLDYISASIAALRINDGNEPEVP